MRKLKLRKGRRSERWITVEPLGLSADVGHRGNGQASPMRQNPSFRNFCSQFRTKSFLSFLCLAAWMSFLFIYVCISNHICIMGGHRLRFCYWSLKGHDLTALIHCDDIDKWFKARWIHLYDIQYNLSFQFHNTNANCAMYHIIYYTI